MRRALALALLLVAPLVGIAACKRHTPTPAPAPGPVVHFGASNPRSQWVDYEDLGADASGVVKTTAGNLHGLYVLNNNTAIRYAQVFDSSTAPAVSATPRLQFAIPPSGEIIVGNDFWQPDGIGFTNGIAWGISTTKGTFIAATPSDHDIMAIYR